MCVALALADFPARHFQYAAASFCVCVCGAGKGQREALSKHWSGSCLHVRLAWHKQTKIANAHTHTRTHAHTHTQWETVPYYCFALVVPPTPTPHPTPTPARSASNVCESQLQSPSPLPASPRGLEVAVVVIARADTDNVIKNSFKANVPACVCVYVCMWVCQYVLIRGQKDAFDFDTCAWKKGMLASVFPFDTFQLTLHHNANQHLLCIGEQLVACLRWCNTRRFCSHWVYANEANTLNDLLILTSV